MQYSKIGTNVNQIAHMVNMNKYITTEQLTNVKSELEKLNENTKEVLKRWPLQS